MKRKCSCHGDYEKDFHKQFNFKIKIIQFLINYIATTVYPAHFGHVEIVTEMLCLQWINQ